MFLSEITLKLTEITSSYRFKLILEAYNKRLKKGDKVLDIGCGNGIISKLIKDQFSVDIIGCDIKNYLVYDIPFVKLTGHKLPFRKRSFDVILLNDVLHHITNSKQEFLINDSTRVAKKVLIFDAKPTIMGKIADVILNKYHYGDLKIPLTFKNVEEWRKIFKKNNIKFTYIKLKRPFLYPFSHIAFELYIM